MPCRKDLATRLLIRGTLLAPITIADEVVRNQYFTGKFFVLYILRIQTQTAQRLRP
jgi:hypothetical protein